MALVVEDGTVVAGANSYVSQADATAYHADRNNTDWAALTSTQKDAALIKATQYVDNTFRRKWIGSLYDLNQPLCWPRTYYSQQETLILSASAQVIPAVPKQLKDAVCEAALLSLSTDLFTPIQRGVSSERVGEIAITYSSANIIQYPAVVGLLSDLTINSNIVVRS